MRTQIRIDEPFSGMPGVPQGGYLAGLLAAQLGPVSAVRLLRPVQLGTVLSAEAGDGEGRLLDGDTVVAEGRRTGHIEIDVPRVSLDEAKAATERFPGFRSHLFPTCFCCGPERLDGLRIFPGPVDGRAVVAAPWTPGGSSVTGDTAPIELIWTALDCPAIWAQLVEGPQVPGLRGLTGQMEVEITQAVQVGDPLSVIGWAIGVEGRRLVACAAVLTSLGDPIAVARQTLVTTGRGFPMTFDDWAAASATR